MKTPGIHTQLLDETNKQADPVRLKLAAQNTIDAYPSDWIHVYTDGYPSDWIHVYTDGYPSDWIHVYTD